MLSEATMASALARAGVVDASVRFDEVTGSTQAIALELAAAGAPEWTFVGAGHQTEGRGRLDRTWVDRVNSALLFSFVLRPIGLAPADAGVLSLLAGSAMAESGTQIAGVDVRCKWPNDLLVGDQKIGGILGSSEVGGGRIAYAVIGIGLNVSVAPEDVTGAAALPEVDVGVLLERFAATFHGSYAPGSPSFARDVVEAYRPRCATLGRRVRIETVEGGVEGTAVDVDPHGALVVETSSGRLPVGFGEVVHVDR